MDEDLETFASGMREVRESFVRDAAEMRGALAGSMIDGAEAAGRGIESALRRATRAGKLEFQDLARVAGRALGEITSAALRLNGGGGLGSALASTGIGLLGLPGRATGGPVSPGQAYMVGERGPELFVPTASGRVEPSARPQGNVQVTVNISAPQNADQAFMARTGRQVARSVRQALNQVAG